MARSSLMRLVRTLAARTRPGPSTPEEAVRREDRRQRAARNAEQRERRRELLRRGLAVTAVGALAPATGARAAIAAGRQRVVVVGGGLAGLSAAWQLAQQGIERRLPLMI